MSNSKIPFVAFALIGAYIVGALGLWGGAIYIALHFIGKFW